MINKRLLSLLFQLLPVIASTQIITTVAGNGTSGYSGDGGPATGAQFANPFEVATDNNGNLFIADAFNNTIRKVDNSGIITTIAGTGVQGYSGDGGPATSATLYRPFFVSVDNFGNIYFSDQLGHAIRKIDLTGTITTITGNLPGGYSGDGGPLIQAQFGDISGIAFDNSNNMYITDFINSVIRKVNTAGIITTFAGNGVPGNTGDGGPATAANIRTQSRVAVDNNNNVYIVSHVDNKIRVVSPSGIISTFAGTGAIGYSGDGGPASAATFNYPWHICFDAAGNMFVPDYNNKVIRKIDPAGIISTYAGNGTYGYSGDGGPALLAQIGDACGSVCDNAGNLYIVQRDFQVVRKISPCLAVTIQQHPAPVTVCNPGNAQFTVIASNAAAWQWQVNTGSGWNNISDDATYSASITNQLSITNATAIMNGYQYRCAVTNNCGTVFSLFAVLNVTAPITPSVTINASSTDICMGSNVVFAASSLNAGSSPAFQWIKNGINSGNNSPIYNDNTLADGDIISCTITAGNGCFTSPTANSNVITMHVNALAITAVTITASSTDICPGETINFTSVSNNTGSSPAYTWFINGTNLFLNSPAFSTNALHDGDYVLCVMQSSLACVSSSVVVSNPVLIHLKPAVTPSVSIVASATQVCKGDAATVTANPVNGGSNPVFTWIKNGMTVGSVGMTYTYNNVANGDIINCILTSSDPGCLTSPTANSNAIPLSLYPDPVVTLDHSTNLCNGDNRVLNAGNFSSYVWSDGSTGRTLTVSSIGSYYVTVTDQNGCRASDTTHIDTILPIPFGFAPADTSICAYGSLSLKAATGYQNYIWNNGAGGNSLSITQPGDYWLEVTDNNGCKAKDTVTVSLKDCIKGFYVPTAFTPNHDGKNEDFKPFLFGNVIEYRFTIYDRWGQIVFRSNNPAKGWDGSLNGTQNDTGVFVWICQYQFQGEKKKTEKGTVILVR